MGMQPSGSRIRGIKTRAKVLVFCSEYVEQIKYLDPNSEPETAKVSKPMVDEARKTSESLNKG